MYLSNLQPLHLTLEIVISSVQVDRSRVKQRYVGVIKLTRHIVHRLTRHKHNILDSSRAKQRYVGLIKLTRHIVHRLIRHRTHYIG